MPIPAESLTSVLRILCLSNPLTPVFVCWLSFSSCCCLERATHPSSRFAYLYVPHWCSFAHLGWAFLASWPPHFHLRPSATVTMFYMLHLFLISAFVSPSLHTTCCFLRSIFCWQIWSIFFSFSVSDYVSTPYNGTGSTQESRTSLSLVSGICRPA